MNKVQILNKIEVALKSDTDDVFAVTLQGIVKLEKGRYGGWLLRRDQEAPSYGVWCYHVERKEADKEAVERTRDIQERVAKVANLLGVRDRPLVSTLLKRFRAVKLIKDRENDKYVVYDIEATDREATATLAFIYYHVWWSKRGRCHGSLCGILEKYSKLLRAEFSKDANVAVSDVGVYVPYDVTPLIELLNELEREERGEEEAATAGAEWGGEALGRGGWDIYFDDRDVYFGDWDTYFIVVKLPPSNADVVAKLEEEVRRLLREWNITAAVQSIRADL